MPSRRSFLRAGAAAGAGLLLPLDWIAAPEVAPVRRGHPLAPRAVAASAADLTKFTEQLPAAIPTINAKSGGTFDLAMAPATHRFHAGLPPTSTWGYAGASYLGPTFEAKRGVPITVRWTNNLGAHPLASVIDATLHGAVEADKTRPRAAVHLHGGHVEARSDGGPKDTFLPGSTYTYHYANVQEATTLWYHDHALGLTRLNVFAGLAGFYWIRDDRDTGLPDNPLGLPAGKYEVPLVIQDKRFNADGTLLYPALWPPSGPPAGSQVPPIWAPEFFGDVAVVNGKAWPNLDVDRALYRFRIVNGSNARFYSLRLSNDQPLHQIGTDGGLLNAPVEMGQVLLGPGERADVLIDFRAAPTGTQIVLANNAPTPFPDGPRNRKQGGAPLKEILRFTVTGTAVVAGSIPRTLRATPIPTLVPAHVRNLALVEVIDPVSLTPVKALLNNLPFQSPLERQERPRANTVEQWNLINTTGDAHPIHLHLVQFQVKERQRFDPGAYLALFNRGLPSPGLPDPRAMEQGPWPAPSADPFTHGGPKKPERNEAGWKDTVVAMPGEITRIVVPFSGAAGGPYPLPASAQPFSGEYVWHCHILEHEDQEMMLPYTVLP